MQRLINLGWRLLRLWLAMTMRRIILLLIENLYAFLYRLCEGFSPKQSSEANVIEDCFVYDSQWRGGGLLRLWLAMTMRRIILLLIENLYAFLYRLCEGFCPKQSSEANVIEDCFVYDSQWRGGGLLRLWLAMTRWWIASSMTRNDDEKDYFVTDRELVRFSLSSLRGLLPEAI